MSNVENPQPVDYNSVVADNLRAELARARWSGRKAAQALGLSPNWVQRRLSGDTALEPNDIVLFADFLNIPVERLFSVETTKTPTLLSEGRRVGPAGFDPTTSTVKTWEAPVTFIGDAPSKKKLASQKEKASA